MHLTRKVTEEQKPKFDEITDNVYQSNTLKNIYHNNSVTRTELLPSTFYDEEKLEDTLQTLTKKGLVSVQNKDGNRYFQLPVS